MSDCHLQELFVFLCLCYVFKKDIGKLIKIFMFILCICSLYIINFIALMFWNICDINFLIFYCLTLDYVFLDMRHLGWGRLGTEIATKGHIGGWGNSVLPIRGRGPKSAGGRSRAPSTWGSYCCKHW